MHACMYLCTTKLSYDTRFILAYNDVTDWWPGESTVKDITLESLSDTAALVRVEYLKVY